MINKKNLCVRAITKVSPLNKAAKSVIASSLLIAASSDIHALNWEFENGVNIDLDTSFAYNAA